MSDTCSGSVWLYSWVLCLRECWVGWCECWVGWRLALIPLIIYTCLLSTSLIITYLLAYRPVPWQTLTRRGP